MESTHQPLFVCKSVVYLNTAFYHLLQGSVYPTIKSGYEIFQIATDDIPSKVVFAGYRFLFAGLSLLLLTVVQRKPIGWLSPCQYGQLTLLGLTQTSPQYVFFYIGPVFTTGMRGSVMDAIRTFFSVPLAHFIYHNDKLNHNRALGCILGFTGVMAVNFSSRMDLGFNLLGDGSIVVTASILSVATLYGKRISQTVDPTVMTGYQLGGGGLVLVIDGYAFGGTLVVHGVSSATILGYLTLLSSVAFALQSILLKHNRMGVIAPFNFLILVSGVILSAIFLGENILEWKYAVVLVLVCLGIWWANKVRR